MYETESAKSFLAQACKLWNKISLEFRRTDSLPVFKKSLCNVIFKEQLSLNHFSI